MFKRASFIVASLVAATPAFAQGAAPASPATTTEQRQLRQPPPSVAQILETARVQSATARLRGFSIVLVQGDVKGNNDTGSVPAAALKAMADLKDFLPYKSYQHLDTQWIVGSGRLVTRLQRPGQVYEVEMEVATGTSQVVNVNRFVVKESTALPAIMGEAPASPSITAAELRLQLAVVALRDARTKFDVGLVSRDAVASAEDAVARSELQLEQTREQVAAVKGAQQNARGTVIDSSFRMNIGETLVVGTSKIPGATTGDRALIVLLTAVAR